MNLLALSLLNALLSPAPLSTSVDPQAAGLDGTADGPYSITYAQRLPSVDEVRQDSRFLTEGIWNGVPLMIGGTLVGGLTGVALSEGMARLDVLGRRSDERNQRQLLIILATSLTGAVSGVLYGAGVPARRRGGECSLLARWIGMLPGIFVLSIPIIGLAGPPAGATWACRRGFTRYE